LSQIALESVAIEDVVARAPIIIVGTVSDPPTSQGERAVADGCEPITATRYHVTVDRVLRTTPDGPAERDKLIAWAAYTDQMVDLAVRECKEGVRKSPIQEIYDLRDPWIAGESVVLFLTWDESSGYQFVVHGGWELGKRAKRIEKLLAPAS
jgi:hypothetical protein